jgi:hypothetical protein
MPAGFEAAELDDDSPASLSADMIVLPVIALRRFAGADRASRSAEAAVRGPLFVVICGEVGRGATPDGR